jgi:hypothetical protein
MEEQRYYDRDYWLIPLLASYLLDFPAFEIKDIGEGHFGHSANAFGIHLRFMTIRRAKIDRRFRYFFISARCEPGQIFSSLPILIAYPHISLG